jgi:hypothetical protein
MTSGLNHTGTLAFESRGALFEDVTHSFYGVNQLHGFALIDLLTKMVDMHVDHIGEGVSSLELILQAQHSRGIAGAVISGLENRRTLIRDGSKDLNRQAQIL